MTETRLENKRLWEAWSDDFQAMWRGDTGEGELPPAPLLEDSIMPAGDRAALLAGMEGADVVELGCGGGQHSVGFAREGAGTVTGVDLATGQLQYARELRSTYDVDAEFVAGDVVALPFDEDAFDFAFSSWALQMVDDLEACFADVRRVLREGGVFVFNLPHPFYELFDRETHELKFSYHAHDRRQFTIEEEYDAEMVVFNRSVGELHDTLVDAGFTVERLLEPGSEDPDEYEDADMDSDPDLMSMVPRALHVRAVVV